LRGSVSGCLQSVRNRCYCWGSGTASQQEDRPSHVSFGRESYGDTGCALAEDEVWQQCAGARRTDEFEQDQEVVGAVAEIGFETAELAAHADMHLAVSRARLAGRPGELGKVGDRDPLGVSLGMVFREYDADVLAEQVFATEIGVYGARLAVVLIADHHVQLLQPERRRGLFDLELGGLDADVGVCVGEAADRGRDDADEGGLERSDPDDAGDSSGGDGGQLRLGCLDSTQQRGRVPYEDLACSGQTDVAADPLE
jgi:hypothetical protein